MKNKNLFKILILLIIIISSCKKNMTVPPDNPPIIKNYLHISHTRTKTNPKMDSVIESINYKKFDMLWLGGDLTYHTSFDDETMFHVDSIFDVGNVNTLWSIGNHDYTNIDRIQSYTRRPLYYSYYKNRITFIILDTQDSLSNIIGSQKEFFNSVVDTIQKSSYLIILHHKLIWMYDNPDLEPQISSVANGGFGNHFYSINPNNFYTDIYPKLLEVKERGVEVICIAGDIGVKVKEFEYLTDEGIYFLASGICADSSDNKGLLFYHNITDNQLDWEFILTTG